jgi:hypothetical protein
MLLRSIYAALLVALLALVPTAKAEVADDSAVGNATLTDTKHALDSSVPGIAHPSQLSLEPASEKPAPRIVNLVNFIRGIEPREPIDLVEPVREQIRLAHEHKLPTTFLIQYDALVSPAFTDLLKRELGPDDEVGAWLEVVQPQVEAAGLKWRGRFPWDWHTDVGFTIGYSPDERQKLMDVYMEKFKATFGRLPRSVGCWVIDGMRVVSLAPDGTTRSIDFGEPTVTELGKDSLLVTMSITSGGELKILMEHSTVHVDMTGDGAPKRWAIELAWDTGKATSIANLEEHAIRYRHNGFDYALRCGNAVVTKGSDTQSLLIRAQGPNVTLTF